MPKKTHSFLRRLVRKGPNKLLEPRPLDTSDPYQSPSSGVPRSSPQTLPTETESNVEETTRSTGNIQANKKKKSTGKVVGWYRRKGDHNPVNYRIKLDDSLKDHEFYARVTEFPPKKLSKAQKQQEKIEFEGGFQAGLVAQGGSKSRTRGSEDGGGYMETPMGPTTMGPTPLMSGGLGVPTVAAISDETAGGGPGFHAPRGVEGDESCSANFVPGGRSTSAGKRGRTNKRTEQLS